MTELMCPKMSRVIFTVGNEGHLFIVKCQESKCQWWMKGDNCAVVVLARKA